MVKHLYRHKKLDPMKGVLSWTSIVLHWLEIFVALVVIAFVVMGAWVIVSEGQISHFHGEDFYHGFEAALSNILLLIIGIELAILLIRRSPESLVEVMFFVVARKMLIQSHKVWELLIGVAAIAGLFAVRKYLEHTIPERQFLEVHDKKKE